MDTATLGNEGIADSDPPEPHQRVLASRLVWDTEVVLDRQNIAACVRKDVAGQIVR